MSKNEKENQTKGTEYLKTFQNYFKDKKIGAFIDKVIENKSDQVIKELDDYYTEGDWKKCLDLIRKIKQNKIFKILNDKKRKILLDTLIKKILPNIFFNLPVEIITLLGNDRYLIPKDYRINWKFFYSILYPVLQYNESSISSFIKFYKSLHKFIPEDGISFEDYQKIRKTFLSDLINKNALYAICTFIYFFPCKYIYKDYELQFILLKMIKNSKTNFVYCCCMFSKILKKNGKLFFSPDNIKNDEYIKTFIQHYFTYLNLYIIGNFSVINSTYISPISMNENKNKNSFDRSVSDILVYLLFNKNLEKHNSFIEGHLKLFLNNSNLYLEGKSKGADGLSYLLFVRSLINKIHSIFCNYYFDEKVNWKIFEQKPYKGNEYIYGRLLSVLKYFSLILNELFLYENSVASSSEHVLFTLLSNIDNDKYMKDVLLSINFNNYLKMIIFLKENSETKMDKFIQKLISILPLLISKYVYSNYPKLRIFIKETLIFLSENVSSANSTVDIDILFIFCTYFYSIKDKNDKIYDPLIPLINESTVIIMNNLIRILDLICLNNYTEFLLFISSMKNYLDKETKRKISLTYANFIQNNEIESKNLIYYFDVISNEEHIQIFNYIYNNLLYVDHLNNVEISKHFLYPIIDKDQNINISQCSVEILIEKQLQIFQKIFSFIDFSKILTSQEMIKKYYEMYYALINQKDNRFIKLGMSLFGYAINTLLDCHINSFDIEQKEMNLIEYPNKENINLANEMYNKLIIPYEEYVIKYINSIANAISFETDNQTVEKIIYIYISLIYEVSDIKLNILFLINENEKNLPEYDIIREEINQYTKYKTYFNYSLKIIENIFEYNKMNPNKALFTSHITSGLFDEIISLKLSMNIKKINSENTWIKDESYMMYQYFHLPHFRNLFDKKLVFIWNYNFFELCRNFITKDELYYKYLNLYLQNYNSVNHPSSYISLYKNYLYPIDKNKIKELYEKYYDEYIKVLLNINEDSETQQNIMKNISDSYFELCLIYITFYQYESINAIKKIFEIIMILKSKNYRKLDFYILKFITKVSTILEKPSLNSLQFVIRLNKFSGKNDIIEKEINNIYYLLKICKEKKIYFIKYKNMIRNVIEISLKMLFFTEEEEEKTPLIDKKTNKKTEKGNINKELAITSCFNESEIILLFFILLDYVLILIEPKDELYKKIIKLIMNNIFSEKVSLPLKYLWIKKLHSFIENEYSFYLEYKWIKFESNEEYHNYWNKNKYEFSSQDLVISEPVEAIRINSFKPDISIINENLKYNLDEKQLVKIMKNIDDWEEDQRLLQNSVQKLRLNSLDELVSKLITKNFENKSGLDFKYIDMFFYLFSLKYIDFNNCIFIKNYNFGTDLELDLSRKEKIGINSNFVDNKKNTSVKYEFLLGKYRYMFHEKIFNEESRKELWKIMNGFTCNIDKNADERIYAFFHYILKNFKLKDIEFIFKDSNFYQYHIDFVVDMYYLFYIEIANLRSETKMFDNEKTKELIDKIFYSDENLILNVNYISYVLTIYFYVNGYLKYDYYLFTNTYTNDLLTHFIELMGKDNSKHSRYALYRIYLFLFSYLNDDLNTIKAVLPKMALCINEFMSKNKLDNKTKSEGILEKLQFAFISYNKPLNFSLLCTIISEILNKEKNSNDNYKLLYLQVINQVYNGQKHLNLYKYSSQEIFDSLYKVFNSIKIQELKKKFTSIFVSYFNDLSEEENENFIKKNQHYIFDSSTDEKNTEINKDKVTKIKINEDNIDEDNESMASYNYIHILMAQILRFKFVIPKYIQDFIIKLKIINKKNSKVKKIIKDALKTAMDNYRDTFNYMKNNISKECEEVLEEMTREKSYFV